MNEKISITKLIRELLSVKLILLYIGWVPVLIGHIILGNSIRSTDFNIDDPMSVGAMGYGLIFGIIMVQLFNFIVALPLSLPFMLKMKRRVFWASLFVIIAGHPAVQVISYINFYKLDIIAFIPTLVPAFVIICATLIAARNRNLKDIDK